MNLLGMLRALVYAYKEKTHADSVGWVVGFEDCFVYDGRDGVKVEVYKEDASYAE